MSTNRRRKKVVKTSPTVEIEDFTLSSNVSPVRRILKELRDTVKAGKAGTTEEEVNI